jgi:hypothetical protein
MMFRDGSGIFVVDTVHNGKSGAFRYIVVNHFDWSMLEPLANRTMDRFPICFDVVDGTGLLFLLVVRYGGDNYSFTSPEITHILETLHESFTMRGRIG